MRSSARLASCPPSLSEYVSSLFHLSFLFILHTLLVMMLKCDDHVKIRLVLSRVAPLTLPTCLGQSALMVLMPLLGSVLWDVTRMS